MPFYHTVWYSAWLFDYRVWPVGRLSRFDCFQPTGPASAWCAFSGGVQIRRPPRVTQWSTPVGSPPSTPAKHLHGFDVAKACPSAVGMRAANNIQSLPFDVEQEHAVAALQLPMQRGRELCCACSKPVVRYPLPTSQREPCCVVCWGHCSSYELQVGSKFQASLSYIRSFVAVAWVSLVLCCLLLLTTSVHRAWHGFVRLSGLVRLVLQPSICP